MGVGDDLSFSMSRTSFSPSPVKVRPVAGCSAIALRLAESRSEWSAGHDRVWGSNLESRCRQNILRKYTAAMLAQIQLITGTGRAITAKLKAIMFVEIFSKY
jgi:hypothetical protein